MRRTLAPARRDSYVAPPRSAPRGAAPTLGQGPPYQPASRAADRSRAARSPLSASVRMLRCLCGAFRNAAPTVGQGPPYQPALDAACPITRRTLATVCRDSKVAAHCNASPVSASDGPAPILSTCIGWALAHHRRHPRGGLNGSAIPDPHSQGRGHTRARNAYSSRSSIESIHSGSRAPSPPPKRIAPPSAVSAR